jgi:hypothetical protein
MLYVCTPHVPWDLSFLLFPVPFFQEGMNNGKSSEPRWRTAMAVLSLTLVFMAAAALGQDAPYAEPTPNEQGQGQGQFSNQSNDQHSVQAQGREYAHQPVEGQQYADQAQGQQYTEQLNTQDQQYADQGQAQGQQYVEQAQGHGQQYTDEPQVQNQQYTDQGQGQQYADTTQGQYADQGQAQQSTEQVSQQDLPYTDQGGQPQGQQNGDQTQQYSDQGQPQGYSAESTGQNADQGQTQGQQYVEQAQGHGQQYTDEPQMQNQQYTTDDQGQGQQYADTTQGQYADQGQAQSTEQTHHEQYSDQGQPQAQGVGQDQGQDQQYADQGQAHGQQYVEQTQGQGQQYTDQQPPTTATGPETVMDTVPDPIAPPVVESSTVQVPPKSALLEQIELNQELLQKNGDLQTRIHSLEQENHRLNSQLADHVTRKGQLSLKVQQLEVAAQERQKQYIAEFNSLKEQLKNAEEIAKKLKEENTKLSQQRQQQHQQQQTAPSQQQAPAAPQVDDTVAQPIVASGRARRAMDSRPANDDTPRTESHNERMAREQGLSKEQMQYETASDRVEKKINDLRGHVDRVVSSYEERYDKAPTSVKHHPPPPDAMDRLSKSEHHLHQLSLRVTDLESTCNKAFEETHQRLEIEKARAEAEEKKRKEEAELARIKLAEEKERLEAKRRVDEEAERQRRKYEEDARKKDKEDADRRARAEAEAAKKNAQENRHYENQQLKDEEEKLKQMEQLEAYRRAEAARKSFQPNDSVPSWILWLALGALVLFIIVLAVCWIRKGSKKKDNSSNFATASYQEAKRADSFTKPVGHHTPPPPPMQPAWGAPPVAPIPTHPTAPVYQEGVVRGGPATAGPPTELRNRVLQWENRATKYD